MGGSPFCLFGVPLGHTKHAHCTPHLLPECDGRPCHGARAGRSGASPPVSQREYSMTRAMGGRANGPHPATCHPQASVGSSTSPPAPVRVVGRDRPGDGVMLLAAAVSAVPLSRMSSEDAMAAWPTITVGSHADVHGWVRGSVLSGLVTCDISRRTPMGNPFKMGPRGDARHLAPVVCHAYSRLLADPELDAAAIVSLTPGVVLAPGGSPCRDASLRVEAIDRLVSLVDGGAKLFLTCCGLDDCHGLPLGRRVLALSSRSSAAPTAASEGDQEGGAADPVARASALLASLPPPGAPSAPLPSGPTPASLPLPTCPPASSPPVCPSPAVVEQLFPPAAQGCRPVRRALAALSLGRQDCLTTI